MSFGFLKENKTKHYSKLNAFEKLTTSIKKIKESIRIQNTCKQICYA